MRHKKRVLLPVISTCFLLSGCHSDNAVVAEKSDRPVKLFEVQDPHTQQLRHFPGTVSASREAEISFRIPGLIDYLAVHAGDEVIKGQTLATLDDQDLQNELRDRQAQFALAKAEYTRAVALLEKKVIPQSHYDAAQATLTSTEAALKLSQDRLSYTTLTAPFAGRIATTHVEPHQQVQAQQSIVTLQGQQQLDVVIQIPEQIISQVRQAAIDPNYQPTVSFLGETEVYPVRYKEHATQKTPGTQSYEVVFTLDAPNAVNILPGMAATITLDLSKIVMQCRDYFLLPLSAVTENDQGQSIVWRYQPDTHTVQAVSVTIGQITATGVEVVEGIEAGDSVVSAGLSYLTDGIEVKPLRKERGL